MKILAVVGSPRPNGNTSYLTDEALGVAKRMGAQTEKILISERKLSPCYGHEECSSYDTCVQKDDGSEILQKLTEADGLIFATPVYYYDVSAWMKIFIDRLYFLYTHDIKCKAKAAGLIVVAGGDGIDHAKETLQNVLGASSIDIPNERLFVLTGLAGASSDARSNQQLISGARRMGRELAVSLGVK